MFIWYILTFGIVLTFKMYVGVGGAYNVDSVLQLMVRGLDERIDVNADNALRTGICRVSPLCLVPTRDGHGRRYISRSSNTLLCILSQSPQ